MSISNILDCQLVSGHRSVYVDKLNKKNKHLPDTHIRHSPIIQHRQRILTPPLRKTRTWHANPEFHHRHQPASSPHLSAHARSFGNNKTASKTVLTTFTVIELSLSSSTANVSVAIPALKTTASNLSSRASISAPKLKVPLMTARPLRSNYASEETWRTILLGNAISRDPRMRLLSEMLQAKEQDLSSYLQVCYPVLVV